MVCKLAVIGVDGITYDVINFLIKKGKMPFFKKILEHGSHTDLKTAPSFQSGPCWSSFVTGKSPGEHGVFEWIVPLDKYEKIKIVDSRDIDSVTFYEQLAERKKVCIINLPLSWPPRIEGTMLTSYLTKGENFVFPSSLKEKYDFSRYKLRPTDMDKIFNVYDKMNMMIDSRVEIWKKLVVGDYDFVYILFENIDILQHTLYDVIFDEQNPKAKKAWEVYSKIDSFIGWLLEKLPQTNFMVLSDHGFRTYDGFFYVNEFLRRQGYLKPAKTRQIIMVQGGKNPVVKMINKNYPLRKILQYAFSLLSPVLPISSNVKCRIRGHLSDGIDLKKSKAFCPSNEVVGVYINNKHLYNVVSEEAYDELREKIIQGINNLGYMKAVKKEDVYSGKNLSKAPDIMLMRERYHISRELSSKISRKEKTNSHYGPGIFITYGPDFKKMQGNWSANIMDLAPTILYFFNEAIPDDLDGKPLLDIFKDDSSVRKRKPHYKQAKERGRIKSAISKIKL